MEKTIEISISPINYVKPYREVIVSCKYDPDLRQDILALHGVDIIDEIAEQLKLDYIDFMKKLKTEHIMDKEKNEIISSDETLTFCKNAKVDPKPLSDEFKELIANHEEKKIGYQKRFEYTPDELFKRIKVLKDMFGDLLVNNETEPDFFTDLRILEKYIKKYHSLLPVDIKTNLEKEDDVVLLEEIGKYTKPDDCWEPFSFNSENLVYNQLSKFIHDCNNGVYDVELSGEKLKIAIENANRIKQLFNIKKHE